MGRLALLSLVSVLAAAQWAAGDIKWQEQRGSHFIVYFTDAGKKAGGVDKSGKTVPGDRWAKNVLRKGEQYYKSIADDLGYPRHSKFWTWDNRVKIYIYPDHESFVKATGQPKWSKGLARYNEKEILSYRWAKEHEFLDALLPHELGHLMFRDFIGFKGEAPLWLDEGVAQWQEPAKRKVIRQVMRKLLKEGRLLPLKKLSSIDHTTLNSRMQTQAVHEFYIQSISLVEFMVTRHGKNRFTNFCRALRDGKTLDNALKSAYSPVILNIEDLEKRWIKHIGRVTPGAGSTHHSRAPEGPRR